MNTRMYHIVSLVLVLFAAVGVNVAYTAQVQRESDARWCDLLVTLDGAYSAQPPTTPTGQRIAAAMKRLRADLCQE